MDEITWTSWALQTVFDDKVYVCVCVCVYVMQKKWHATRGSELQNISGDLSLFEVCCAKKYVVVAFFLLCIKSGVLTATQLAIDWLPHSSQ